MQIDQQHVAFDQLKQQLAVQETRLYEEQRLLQKRLDTIHRIQKELPELQPAELTIRRFPSRQLRFASTSPLSEAAFTDGFLQLEQLIAQEQTCLLYTSITVITIRIVFPCRVSLTAFPKVKHRAAGISSKQSASIKLDSGVAFSYGNAELTPKKPPPLVPSCLMAI